MVDINEIDWDLNLLRVFLVVMQEGNVTRAAQRLYLTQPAVSASLNRLRRVTGDPLFQRTPKGVEPTARALDMAVIIKDALGRLEAMTRSEIFDPGRAQVTLQLACSDFHAHLILPGLMARLEREAPGLELRLRPLTRLDEQLRQLEAGEIDLAISTLAPSAGRILQSQLFRDHYVCFVRPDHPCLNEPWTVEHYCRQRHLAVSFSGNPHSEIDRMLEQQSLSRRVVLTVNQFGPVAALLSTSNLVCTAISRLSRFGPELLCLPLPLEMGPVQLRLLWHERQQNRPALAWLRTQIAQEVDSDGGN